jgi:hypothetical protein
MESDKAQVSGESNRKDEHFLQKEIQTFSRDPSKRIPLSRAIELKKLQILFKVPGPLSPHSCERPSKGHSCGSLLIILI